MPMPALLHTPTLSLHTIDSTAVNQMQAWKYDGIMARYNFSDDPFEQQWICRPQTGHWQVRDAQNELTGFAIIGSNAQTAGIHYQAHAIDLLAGLRPELIGQRRGYEFITQVISHAKKLYPGKRLRTSIPSMHLPALATWQRAGFFPEYAVISADNTPYVVLLT